MVRLQRITFGHNSRSVAYPALVRYVAQNTGVLPILLCVVVLLFPVFSVGLLQLLFRIFFIYR